MMNIAHLRLINQHIADRPFAHAEEVVAWLGAMQGQDYTGTLWSIGLRMKEATELLVEQALADRRIVRTWPMRGTLHFVAAQDVRWLLQLLTPRMIAQAAGRYRQLELDEATFAASQALFVKVLQGGQQLTRDDLYQQLEQAKIATRRKLRMGAVDIGEIALAAGYETHAAFGKAFKQHFGLTPSQFRQLDCATATKLLKRGKS